MQEALHGIRMSMTNIDKLLIGWLRDIQSKDMVVDTKNWDVLHETIIFIKHIQQTIQIVIIIKCH